jgi:hypothetical protein
MRRRAIIGALLLIGVGVVLGGTVLRDQVASARSLAQSVIVSNTSANPVPVTAAGTLPVHEQGTANVNVTNSALSVAEEPPITGGGRLVRLVGGGDTYFSFDTMASALTIHLTDGVSALTLRYCSQIPCESGGQVGTVAVFDGPANGLGKANVDLALTRPIRFNNMRCLAASSSDICSLGWIGTEP